MVLFGGTPIKGGACPAVIAAANLLKDQGSLLTHLNIIRCWLVMVAVCASVS